MNTLNTQAQMLMTLNFTFFNVLYEISIYLQNHFYLVTFTWFTLGDHSERIIKIKKNHPE